MTEQRRMEEALRQADRDRVLMETAGTAAHEINQPLTVIFGLAQLLLETAPEDDAHRHRTLRPFTRAQRGSTPFWAGWRRPETTAQGPL